MTGFGEEDRDRLFGSASRSLEFLRRAFTWGKKKKARLRTAAWVPGHTGVQKSRYP